MLLPTTFEPATEGTFTFRVLTRCSAKLRSVDVTPAIIKTALVKAPASLGDAKGFEQYDAVFMTLCDDFNSMFTMGMAFKVEDLAARMMR